MADKLNYEFALEQVCALMGWIDKVGRGPEFARQDGMTIATMGRPVMITLQTSDRDIGSSWDPLDGDKQLRARDRLVASLKNMWLMPNSTCMVDPSMWKPD